MTQIPLGNVVLIAALMLILAVAAFFLFCRRYEDGFIGNVALVLMAVACVVLLGDAWLDRFTPPDPAWCLLTATFAVFQARHAYRFTMFHWAGRFGWKRPQDVDSSRQVEG